MSFITSFSSNVFIASGDVIRFFRIGENELKPFIEWSDLNPERFQKPDFEEDKELKSVEKRVILCLAHSNVISINGRRLLAVGTNEKQIHVFEYFVDQKEAIVKAEHIVTSVVPKAPTSVAFDKEDSNVVVGDRAGDVHRFSVLDGRAKEMAGAISMILDVALTPDGKRLVMADRDEKVRVMRYPLTYVIDAYCLGHTEYVKTVAIQGNDSIWSAGGDKFLHNWAISDFAKPRKSLDLSEYKAPIRKIAINLSWNKIAVVFEKSDVFLIVDVSENPLKATSINMIKESQFLDVTATGKYFVVLGRSTISLIDAETLQVMSVRISDENLQNSLTSTDDAIDNLFKNVTHQNQQEYEKRKAEKFEQIEKKKRRANEDVPTSS